MRAHACVSVCVAIAVVLPLRSGVFAVERIFELDNVAVPFTQKVVLLHVVLHQLGQSGELLPSIQVIVIARILDLNVSDFVVPPNWG